MVSLLVAQLPAQLSQVNESRFPVLKSALIPGWGQHDSQASVKGFVFNGIEAGIWVFAALAADQASSYEYDLYYHASEYGQIIDPQGKGDLFLDRVSKYDNMDEYNEQMLRNRQWDRLYSEEDGYYWNWESESRRKAYFDLKTQRYRWRQRVTYAFGAVALNHLVSAMDALILKKNSTDMLITPTLGRDISGIQLSFNF